jgi:hypothetical protein
MPGTRIYQFDVDSLAKLLTHYSEGAIPLDAEVVSLEVSARLSRMISLLMRSKDWDSSGDQTQYGELEPYHFRYEGRRTMTWNDRHEPIIWSDPGEVEAPKLQ